jgi:suppressor for copper-sensitivity B
MTGLTHRRASAFAATGATVLGLAVVAFAGDSARAESATPWSNTVYAQVRLVSAVTAAGTGETVPLGLHFKMEKGWKIYWRAPGDAGFPPKLKWEGSDNVAAVGIRWPTPERFKLLDVDSIGYKDEVVLPLALRPATPGRALAVAATVDFLTCDQICVPHTVKLALALPEGPARPSAEAHLVNRFAARVPGDGAVQGLAVERVEARDLGGKSTASVVVVARSQTPFGRPDVFLDGPATAHFGVPSATFAEGRHRAVLTVPVEGAGAAQFVGQPISVTLTDGERAVERALVAVAASGPAPAPAGGVSLVAALGFALIGGLILNLMPCVLPVLSLKLLALVGHGGRAPRGVRLAFVASAAGILSAFLLLAGALIALKAAGAAIGWGIQFQQPWFLAAMILVTTLFAANLWGLFEVSLPEAVAEIGASSTHVHGLGGHFLAGAFATLLATPCTAPFLGTAIGFALARGAIEILAVFAALGIGLALPYLAVAAAPRLATRLPRPGRWVIRLKQVLGLALAGTALWLASVLVAQVGTAAALAASAGGAALLIVLALRARRLLPSRAALGALALIALATVAAPTWLARAAFAPAPVAAGGGPWRPFEEDRIAREIAAGKTVFVDVTADWCITCKANKALVLNQGEVAKRLAREPVVALSADWTRPDERIAAYLARFGRYGIPFNVVYGPGAPEGIPLPELLTSAEVLVALDKAQAIGRAARRP